jgi:hypothetical protein
VVCQKLAINTLTRDTRSRTVLAPHHVLR